MPYTVLPCNCLALIRPEASPLSSRVHVKSHLQTAISFLLFICCIEAIHLMLFHLINVCFCCLSFWSHKQNIITKSEGSLFPMSTPKNAMVWEFTTYIFNPRGVNLCLWYKNQRQASSYTFYRRCYTFPMVHSCCSCQKLVDCSCMVYFWSVYSVTFN